MTPVRPRLHRNDINTKLIFNLDPTGENELAPGDIYRVRIKVRKPDGTIDYWQASVADTTAVYLTQIGDLDQVGEYIFQPMVSLHSGWYGAGTCVKDYVYPSDATCPNT